MSSAEWYAKKMCNDIETAKRDADWRSQQAQGGNDSPSRRFWGAVRWESSDESRENPLNRKKTRLVSIILENLDDRNLQSVMRNKFLN